MNSIILTKNGKFSLKSLIENDSLLSNDEILININSDITVTLNDDLDDFGIYFAKIKIVLNEQSSLFYQFKQIDIDSIFTESENQNVKERMVSTICAGQGSVAELKCLVLGNGFQTFKFNSIQHHLAEESKSNLIIKSVLFDSAKLFCENLIKIEKNAQRVCAYEQNKNLLLGKNAKVRTVPKLEIEANDVSCKHGAAISRLNDEHLFYMQSRGLDLMNAKKMLIEAFLT